MAFVQTLRPVRRSVAWQIRCCNTASSPSRELLRIVRPAGMSGPAGAALCQRCTLRTPRRCHADPGVQGDMTDVDSMRPMESPILIDVWTVDPSQQGELARGISDGVRNVIAGHRGFVSAQLYEGTNGDTMMVMVRMRTIKERQELTDSPEAHNLMRKLRTIARSHVRLFQLVENFGEPDGSADRRLEPEA
jgi:hypothetical protein